MPDCSQCGTPNQPDASFCTRCGAPLTGAQAPPPATPPVPPSQPSGLWRPPEVPGAAAPPPGMGAARPPTGVPPVARAAPNEGTAIAAMILGIASYPFICAFGGGLIFAVLAVVFGYIARNKIDESAGALGGRTMAEAGIWLGWISIALHLILGIVVLVLVLTGVWWASHSSAIMVPALLARL